MKKKYMRLHANKRLANCYKKLQSEKCTSYKEKCCWSVFGNWSKIDGSQWVGVFRWIDLSVERQSAAHATSTIIRTPTRQPFDTRPTTPTSHRNGFGRFVVTSSSTPPPPPPPSPLDLVTSDVRASTSDTVTCYTHRRLSQTLPPPTSPPSPRPPKLLPSSLVLVFIHNKCLLLFNRSIQPIPVIFYLFLDKNIQIFQSLWTKMSCTLWGLNPRGLKTSGS